MIFTTIEGYTSISMFYYDITDDPGQDDFFRGTQSLSWASRDLIVYIR